MALQLKISATEFIKSFAVFNKTGEYSKDNPGGFGGPNPRIEDITSSIIQIEGPMVPSSPNFDPQQAILNSPPGSNAYVPPPANGQPLGAINPLSANLQLVGNFPNKKNLGYEITPYVIGSGINTSITSGKWTIRWTVSGIDIRKNPFTCQTLLVVVFINNVTCCVSKQTDKLTVKSFDILKDKAIIQMGVLLRGARKSIECGKFDDADQTIRFLNQQCVCVTC